MCKVEFIQHSSLTKEKLDEIIAIKSVSWPYNKESQLKWIFENIENHDIHVLMYIDNIVMAYLNLKNISITINSKKYDALGIGNVCAREQGKGWGSKIIGFANDYIVTSNAIGVLFCKPVLTYFYKLNNWRTIEKSSVLLDFNNDSIETMICNYDQKVDAIQIFGKIF